MPFTAVLETRLTEELFRVFGLGVTIHAPTCNVTRWSFRVPVVTSRDICY